MKSRGRSVAEVIVAVTFMGFLTGFVVVLCIGNYYRAKKAMLRQHRRRIARLTGAPPAPGGVIDSPRSQHSSSTASHYSDTERQHLLHQGHVSPTSRQSNGGGPPFINIGTKTNGSSDNYYHTQQLNSRRQAPYREVKTDSLIKPADSQERAEVDVMSV
mmetsp:Transcript_5602/g.7972  ORF Transcript_5602/g.7972 Transcript_5602/m.7972 type:complete len:159 (+) Transcript_5602:198-674(+)